MPTQPEPKLLAWGENLMEPETIRQASRASRLPFVPSHVALMPDAHVGMGATIGSVIPTLGAIIPSAVGVDIGCGMIAAKTTLDAKDLPDNLDGFLRDIERTIPAGVGQGSDNARLPAVLSEHQPERVRKSNKLWKKTWTQFGSLGSGNHFFEMCLDMNDDVWLVLHSGSRGVGNALATDHIKTAKGLMKRYMIHLEDPDLAYLVEGTPEFDEYVSDMLWSQDYALYSREKMMRTALLSLRRFTPPFNVEQRINCHHNFTQREHHHGKNVWVTRKGAIKAATGDLGVIPGSMGAATYIVEGLGNEASYCSCSHGAGRTMSRTKARAELDESTFKALMGSRTWQSEKSKTLLDEHPMAYKDIGMVMQAQADLVKPLNVLRQIVNYKGA